MSRWTQVHCGERTADSNIHRRIVRMQLKQQGRVQHKYAAGGSGRKCMLGVYVLWEKEELFGQIEIQFLRQEIPRPTSI